ncbi:NDR1/HIN1-like protein 1 [Typha latifolia]|uniref:NDR1/HIN1-like protein 1 n=1 Tax=Typha latifolia TaxID=4733 RepID=UPI003C2CCDF9
MSAKDCGSHDHCKSHKFYRHHVFKWVIGIVVLIIFIILVIWLVLRPTKPKYYLQDTTVSNLTLYPNSNTLSTIIQVTLSSRNPNDRIGIYYDKLDVYAEYKGQQITIPTLLPRGYQGHNDVSVWSPYLSGEGVPLAPYLLSSLMQDEHAGYMLINIRVYGRLRWKVGTWISGHYHIDVNCPAFLTVNNGDENGYGAVFHFQHMSSCSVEV